MHSRHGLQDDRVSMSTPGERLRAARIKSGFSTAKDAAVAMGVPIATYTQHELTTRALPARRAAQYAYFFDTTPEYLLFAYDGRIRDSVPVVDTSGHKTGNFAPFPPAPSEMTVAQASVEGDGIAHFDFVALYDEPQGASVDPHLIGELCVVCLKDSGVKPDLTEYGEVRLIRVLKKGTTAHTYHLLSLAGGLPEIDQKLSWAAKVRALVPAKA